MKNNHQSGSSYKLMYDFKNPRYKDKFKSNPQTLDEIIEKRNKNDINFINYICDYINTAEIETNDNDKNIIVGDVHASILQLFMPLKQANILKKLEFDNEKTKFTFKLNELNELNEYKQVIYCGDFVGRAKHPLTVEILIAFLEILNEINENTKIKTNNIVWVFGNHDIGFIKHFIDKYKYKYSTTINDNNKIEEKNEFLSTDVYESELNDIVNSKNLERLLDLLEKYVNENKYPCVYYSNDENIIVSHTFTIYTNKSVMMNRDYIFVGLNILYSLFEDINFNEIDEKTRIYLNRFIINLYRAHNAIVNSINKQENKQTIYNIFTNNVDKEDEYYKFAINCIDRIFYSDNKDEFEKLEISAQVDFINKLAKEMVIKNNFEFYHNIEHELYWLIDALSMNNPIVFKNSNLKHFVGHEAKPIINNYITMNHINEMEKIKNIDDLQLQNVNVLHKTFINNLIKSNSKSNPNYDYNNNIIIENLKYAKLIQLLINENLHILNTNLENTYNSKTNCYDLDITATSGIIDKFYARYLIRPINENINYISNEFIASIEIGFNMSTFAIIDNKNIARCSKLYLF
jgi:hypothetical protein